MTKNNSEKSALPLSETLLRQLEETPQNPQYHAEGNVLVHTEKVLQQFHEHVGEWGLNEEEQDILYWVSVMHDLGKIEATKFHEGRWVSHGHEKISARMAREILLENPEINQQKRNTILELISWHGFPLRWILKSRSLEELKQLGTRLNLKLLSAFAVLDMLGRESFDQEKIMKLTWDFHQIHSPQAIYELGSTQTLLETYRAWPYEMKNAAWKSLEIQRPHLLEALLERPPVDNKKPKGKIIFATGPSLSGKTTEIKRAEPESFLINLHDFDLIEGKIENKFELDRRIVEFKHLLAIYVRHHKTVVIEASISGKFIRTALNKVFRDLNVEIEYWMFETPLQDLIARNEASDTPLPEAEIRRSFYAAEMPHPWEAHAVRWVENRGV